MGFVVDECKAIQRDAVLRTKPGNVGRPVEEPEAVVRPKSDVVREVRRDTVGHGVYVADRWHVQPTGTLYDAFRHVAECDHWYSVGERRQYAGGVERLNH